MKNRNSKNSNYNLAYNTQLLTFDRYNLYLKAPLIATKLNALLLYVLELEKQSAFHQEELTFFYQQLTHYFIYINNKEAANNFAKKYFEFIKKDNLALAAANYALGSAYLLNEDHNDPTYFINALKLCESAAQENKKAEILRINILMQLARIKSRQKSTESTREAFFDFDEASSALLKLVKHNKSLYHDIAYIYQWQGELRLRQGNEAQARVLFAGAATAWDKFNKFMGSEHPQLNHVPFIEKKLEPTYYQDENPSLIKEKLLSYLECCNYVWPNAITAETLNAKIPETLNYIQTLLDKRIEFDSEMQPLVNELIYKVGIYQLYVTQNPSSVIFLLQSLEDKLEGEPLAWLRNHLAYAYTQLFIEAKKNGETNLARVYEKNIRNYTGLIIDDYRDAESKVEKQILAYAGFIVGLMDHYNGHYSDAFLNIDHSIKEFSEESSPHNLLPSLKLASTLPFIAINYCMATSIFLELESYWNKPENVNNLQVAQFYKQYGDFLATQRVFGNKEKATELYQQAYRLLLANPGFAPELRKSLQEMLVNGEVLLKKKYKIVFFQQQENTKNEKVVATPILKKA